MRGVGHVIRMWYLIGVYKFLVGKLRERYLLGDPGVDGRLILKCIFRKWNVKFELD
jgi:hypothetical protein